MGRDEPPSIEWSLASIAESLARIADRLDEAAAEDADADHRVPGCDHPLRQHPQLGGERMWCVTCDTTSPPSLGQKSPLVRRRTLFTR